MSLTTVTRARAPFRMILALILAGMLAVGVSLPAAAESPDFGPSVLDGTIGSNKGRVALRECPADKALVGVRVEDRTNGAPANAFGIIIDFDILCGTIGVDSPSTITVTNDAAFTDFGGFDQGDGAPETAICPANTVVTKMGGDFFNGSGFRWASDIQISCQPLRFDAQGRIRVNTATAPVVLQAGDNENLNAPNGFAGPFCGTNDTLVVRGYRPQGGGEGFDGINVSCAAFASDFGDAPASYASAGLEVNGATYLGEAVDSDVAEQPSDDADGDGGDDDGVVLPAILGGVTPTATATVTATNFSPVAAVLTGWIDFDRNGTFDDDERVTAPVAPGFSGPIDLTFQDVDAQTSAAGGKTAARFTIATAGVGGEVEDYILEIAAQEPSLSIVKSSTTASTSLPGQQIPYGFEVANTGNVVISNIVIDDPNLDSAPTCDVIELAPGESTQCTGTHTVTQDDVDAGQVENTATVSGTPPGSTTPIPPIASNQVIVPAVQSPALSIVKSSTTTEVSAAGEEIAYSFAVTNTGNVTMSAVAVADEKLDAPATCDETVLAPGGSAECSGVHTVTQAELDSGAPIINSATVSATPPGSTTPIPPVASNEVVIPTRPEPALSIVKSSSTAAVAAAGQQIEYSFAVTNTGNVSVADLTIDDPQLDGAVTCDATALAPGASTNCSGVHTVTQNEVDAGDDIVNIASVAGTAPGSGAQLPPTSSNEVRVPVQQTPALTIEKSTTATSITAAGQAISYAFIVTNTGNVTVSAVAIADEKLDAAATCDATTLAPGATATCAGVHTVTQDELDAGDDVVNTATVSALASGSTTPLPPTPSNTVSVPTAQTPALSVVKSSATTAASAVGQELGYTFVVTNTGNVTISRVEIADEKLDAPATCDLTEIAPGEIAECVGVHTVTAAELDSGDDIVNVASVTGTPPGTTTPIPPTSSNTVAIPTQPGPALTLDKTASASTISAGATITYVLVAVNTGNVTLSGVVISDDLAGLSDLDCDKPTPATLAVGDDLVCTATYVVTAADVAAGAVRNSAVASGTDPSGSAVSAGDAVDVEVDPAPVPAPGAGAPASPGRLPATGAEAPLALVALASLLVVIGGAIAFRRRRALR